jgi:hypothetical protein
MAYAQDQDFVRLDPIDDDERSPWNDQLPGSPDPTDLAEAWKFRDPIDRHIDRLAEIRGCPRAGAWK